MLRARMLSRANLMFQRHTMFEKQLVCFPFNSRTLKTFLQMAEPIADVRVPIWLGFSVFRLDKSTLEKAVHLSSTLLLPLLKSNNFQEQYWQ